MTPTKPPAGRAFPNDARPNASAGRARRAPSCRRPVVLGLTVLALILSSVASPGGETPGPRPLAGADERTPSRSHYFSWIDNTNEGATERQTLANLGFFQWLHDEYGMELDIYALDAGAIDAPGYYGSMQSDRFQRQFPNGFGPLCEKAKSFGCRLGVWLGPDGFGNTPEEERARTDMLVTLCRDYNCHLFKVDAVCGQLRTNKQEAFVNMLKECRKYCPDLIVLNHRLNRGHGSRLVITNKQVLHLLQARVAGLDCFGNETIITGY